MAIDPSLAHRYHVYRDTLNDGTLTWIAEGHSDWRDPPRPVAYGHGRTPEAALADLRNAERKAQDGG